MPATTAPDIGAVLQEAATLAREFEESTLWRVANVREGAITIQQQAERFAAARNDETRADAALWAREGYMILSSALPDTGHGERATGWATAAQIARLFGGEAVWAARVALAYRVPRTPDSSAHNSDPEYLRALLVLAGLSQREAARRIGISERMMRYYVADEKADHRDAPYVVQFALESLARCSLTTTCSAEEKASNR